MAVVSPLLTSPINVKGVSKSISSVNKNLNQTKSSFKQISEILVKKTKVRRQIFEDKIETKRRREIYSIRKEEEDRLEAPNIVKMGGPPQVLSLVQGSGRSFFGRILSTLGYLAAGWLLRNLPTWVGLGKEFIARIGRAGEIIRDFVTNTINVFKSTLQVLDSFKTNIVQFDLFDSSNRVKDSFDELKNAIDGMGTELENAIKLVTTPLTQTTEDGRQVGTYSGEEVPGLGTTSEDMGAYSGTPAPQVMLEGGISGTTALLPAGAKGADPYVGATDRFGYSSWRGRHHNGIDIGTSGERGYYVAFLLDGTATVIPNNGGAGNTVEIKSGGTTYKFFHLARFSIKSGPYKAGTAIGEIGNTGGSKGIHLHYEVHPPGSRGVDPTPYLNLIKIGKKLGKPTAAPASVSSSSTSQPQQNLIGTLSSSPSSSGGAGRWKPLLNLIAGGESTSSGGYDALNPNRNTRREGNPVSEMTISQAAKYAGDRNDGKNYAVGRYQFTTLTTQAKAAGLNPDKDLFSPANQDKMAIHIIEGKRSGKSWLSGKITNEEFSLNLSNEWGALKSASGNVLPGNSGSIGYDKILPILKQIKSGPSSSPPAQTSAPTKPAQTSAPTTPAPAQISPTPTQQTQQQVAQQITPERKPQDIVAVMPQQAAPSPQSSGAAPSSAPAAAPSMSDVLNTFMKQKLLLDLAYV
jgi:murein DD-endopeptidase MepM/ murein hydrolase activator NlpD/muramidase (phage lysozyme)